MELQASRPLITGAGRGIGRAFVDAFLQAGAAKIYACARTDTAATELASIDPRVVPILVDTTDLDQISIAAKQAPDVNILVNNAGVLHYAGFLSSYNLDAARHEIEVNYFGPLNMARAFAPTLVRHNGAIVNVLSISALHYVDKVGSYNASKAAARSMTIGLRRELADQGVRVLAVYAGGYDTGMHPDDMDKSVLNPPHILTDAVLANLASSSTGSTQDDIFPDAMSQQVQTMLGLVPANGFAA